MKCNDVLHIWPLAAEYRKRKRDDTKEVEKGEVNVWRTRVIVSLRTALT